MLRLRLREVQVTLLRNGGFKSLTMISSSSGQVVTTIKVYAERECVQVGMAVLEEKVHRFYQGLKCLFEHM